MEKLIKIKYLVIHHTQRKNNNSLTSIKKAHLKKGFEDIGYHYLVTKTGRILPARSERFQGAHVLGYNKETLGICLTGNFDIQILNKKQEESLVKLLIQKIKENRLNYKNIRGHKEFPNVQKSCPGKNIDLRKIRKLIEEEMQKQNRKIHN